MKPKLQLCTILGLFIFLGQFASAQTINEVRIDQPSGDVDEYFELAGTPSASLNGLTYVVIGDGSGGSGTIEAAISLDGSSFDSNGFFVAAEATFTLGTADLTTDLPFENGDNVTHLLVSGFSGSVGDDLDTNDDCSLDTQPWTSVVDGVALIEEANPPTGTECHYADDFVNVSAVGPNGSFVPSHVYRDGSNPSTWLIGEHDPTIGNDTPGAMNDSSLPVELLDFTVAVDGETAIVAWETASEVNNSGFEIQIAHSSGEFAMAEWVEAAGAASKGYRYERVVEIEGSGAFRFRLKSVDLDGSFAYSQIVEVTTELASAYAINKLYPNPFSDDANLEFQVAAEQSITVDIVDLLGRRVSLLSSGVVAEDKVHTVSIDGRSLESGIYFLRITGEKFATSKKFVVLD